MQRAIVTGASRGIGRELALNLARKGLTVIAVARDEEKLKNLQKEYPDHIHIVPTDVSTEEGREKIFQKALEFGSIDFLVNNAAILNPLKSLTEVTLAELENIFRINTFAPILLSQKLQHLLVDGRILNVSSSAESGPSPHAMAYCASKAALLMFTKGQQLEYKIAVNSVIPGEIETDMQVTLRQDHPNKKLFQQAAKHGSLMEASTCAAFLAYLLLDVSTKDFVEKTWNIYDPTHRHNWLEEHMRLPEPYVAAKLKEKNKPTKQNLSFLGTISVITSSSDSASTRANSTKTNTLKP